MDNKDETGFAVRVWLEDGTTEPPDSDGLDWVSLTRANKIASKLWKVRSNLVGSQVTAIEIIDADYNTVKIHRFNDKEEDNV